MRRWLVVLVSPKESGNVGAAARVLKNFGAGGLRVVEPRCEILCSDSRGFASGASEILRAAEVFPTLREALADRELSVGLTGVGGRHHRMDCVGLLPTALLEGREAMTRGALVFGREECGLFAEELESCDFLWSLPTQPDFPSLNLAQAIGISLAAVAEVERQQGLARLGRGLMPSDRALGPLAGARAEADQPATNAEYELLGERLSHLMRVTGWSDDRRVRDSVGRLRNVLTRGSATHREVNLLLGCFKHFAGAIRRAGGGAEAPDTESERRSDPG